MARRYHLITYDVADDKRRTLIFNALRDVGDHVQYSVFIAELNSSERLLIEDQLKLAMHQDQDQVLILDLGEGVRSLEGALTCIGKPYQPATRAIVV